MPNRASPSEGVIERRRFTTGVLVGDDFDLDPVRGSYKDLPPPSERVKCRIYWLVLLEYIETRLSWIVVGAGILWGIGGPDQEACIICVSIFAIELTLTQAWKAIQQNYTGGVGCCYIILQFVGDKSRCNSYLAAVWLLRVTGLATGVFAGMLGRRIWRPQSRGFDDSYAVYCLAALGRVLLSLIILFLNSFRLTRSSLFLGFKSLLASLAQQVGCCGSASRTPSAWKENGENVNRLLPAVDVEDPLTPFSYSQGVNRLLSPCFEEVEGLSALVWYFHSSKHIELPPLCAYLTDLRCGEPGESCGLPGHWFLGLEEVLEQALCAEEAERAFRPFGQANQLSTMEQEMGLDALGHYAERRDRPVCDLIVRKGLGVMELCSIATTHKSVGCRERAAKILSFLSNTLTTERMEGKPDPYDPFKDMPVSFQDNVGLHMLNCLASKASPELQENAAGALCGVSASYGVSQRLFCGEPGKILIDQLVDIAAGEGLTDTTRWYALRVLVMVAAGALPSTHSEGEEPDFYFNRVEDEVSWMLPARRAFRESRALPRLVDLALSHRASPACKWQLALVFLSYVRLEAPHLSPSEVGELTRLLQLRFELQPLAVIHVLMTLCDSLVCHFSGDRVPDEEPNRISEVDVIRSLITKEERRFFTNLARFQLFISREFVAKERSWLKFISIFQTDNGTLPTLLWASRSPARLLSYLLTNHFDVLSNEIDEVYEDDHRTSRCAIIEDVRSRKVAAMSVIALSLSELIVQEESRKTKLSACIALTRLAAYRGNCLLRDVALAWRYHLRHSVHDISLENEPEFRKLRDLLGNYSPSFRLELCDTAGNDSLN
ncbi:hypothetical protein CBR_g36516 [Chara braunii]|uniref:Uncharacterized protein n=1 Tax=Chara braunii TaxID=69332 RepID=A0A388LKY7_CHABU|nr:hypothetical protein CBR_g36516 [Chara braunii]|eukprot:GBG82988.1 hypothetical protein CBR_g36516 [Chara braunii]